MARALSTKITSVAFLVRSLEMGGAEIQIASLAQMLNRERFAVKIFCFYRVGPLVEVLEDSGIEVISLGKRGRWDVARFCLQLIKEIRMWRPNVLHSFMGPPNVLAVVFRLFWPKTKIVWGVRASEMNFDHYDLTWRATFRLERWLSHLPDAIVANSFAGRDHILAKGFCGDRLKVVFNGIDTDRLVATKSDGIRLRAKWEIGEGTPLIGIVARLDAKKDHTGFLQAAAILVRQRPDVRFAIVGGDGRVDRSKLISLAASLGIAKNIIWAGQCEDIAPVYAALDIHCSASAFGEGFPNAVAEAMAAGVPCVVTDVGDAARIVDDLGIVVPPSQPEALAEGWNRIFDLPALERCDLGAKCRQRIETHFSQTIMTEKMAAIYENIGGADEPLLEGSRSAER